MPPPSRGRAMTLCRWLVTAIVTTLFALGPATAKTDSLPRIGPAAEFNLTTQDGENLALDALRGKVVVVTFIFASCVHTCPLLTTKMMTVQSRLGDEFGRHAYFVSVTVDPQRDTPAVLKRYAEAHGANLGGWAFLTGGAAEIREVARNYGVAYQKAPGGTVDHTFLTSLVDRDGTLRVQYLGTRFDPDELLRDIRSLLKEKQ